jgi:hypothetical protein
MDEQQAVKFLSSKGYDCLRNQNQPSSSIGLSARQRVNYPTTTAVASNPFAGNKDAIDQRLIAAGVFKTGGKKRSCKKRGGKKRSCKKRGGKKCSCKKRN